VVVLFSPLDDDAIGHPVSVSPLTTVAPLAQSSHHHHHHHHHHRFYVITE
jgi:hypothetical protein